MLLINNTDIMIITENARGFFTGSGNVILFSIDLSDSCSCFMVESKTKIKIFICQDVLHINEMHNVIKKTVFLKLWPQFEIKSSSGRK